MNERIRELAEQAGLEFDDNLVLEPEPIYYTTQKDLEKFAELIVRECAKYVDVMWPHQKEFKGTLDVGKGLKAKFGVEE